jgi:hypothetical protein
VAGDFLLVLHGPDAKPYGGECSDRVRVAATPARREEDAGRRRRGGGGGRRLRLVSGGARRRELDGQDGDRMERRGRRF